MKNMVGFNLEKMKEYLLVTHLEVKDTNVTIRDFGKLLNALMF